MQFGFSTGDGDVSIEQVSTPSLGNHSYVITTGGDTIVLDPQRDLDAPSLVSPERSIVAVCETHVHNDYVSGGFVLASDSSAEYVLPAGSGARYEHRPATAGERIHLGPLWLEVVDTPGHTFHHVSYVLTSEEGPLAVFTGGSMLVAAVGRSDLLGPDNTDSLLAHQYRSVRGLAGSLPSGVLVAPTHGAGSFCSASQVTGTTSTIGAEETHNPACTASSIDEFIRSQKAGYGLFPSYYRHMADVNLAPGDRTALDALPELSVPDAIASGYDIVDVRTFDQYAAGHIRGSIAAPPSDQDATYIGWTLPWNSPIVVVGDADEVESFVVHLSRIGWDAIAGVVPGAELENSDSDDLVRSTVATFADVAAVRPERIVDARDPLDHADGTIRGAIPMHVSRIASDGVEIDGPDVWVHCAGGYRAMVATGFLERQGYTVTTVVDAAPPELTTLL